MNSSSDSAAPFFADMLAGVDEPTMPFGLSATSDPGDGATQARHDDPKAGPPRPMRPRPAPA